MKQSLRRDHLSKNDWSSNRKIKGDKKVIDRQKVRRGLKKLVNQLD